MASLTVLWILVLFWVAVNAFRGVLYFFWPTKLTRLQENYGITLGLFSLSLNTTYFNHWFNTFSPKRSFTSCQYSWYRRYFTAGVWLTMAMFPFALFVILKSLLQTTGIISRINSLLSSNGDSTGTQTTARNASPTETSFTVVIPGVSIPLHECIYFFLAVATSSIIHELGHALAANRHRLKIEHVGMSLFICLPITYVSMEGTHKMKHGTFGQLEVVSAGLLNNAVLCIVTLLCYFFNPIALLYIPANGMIIASVDPLSSISSGANALLPYDIIKSINGNPVTTFDQWNEQLSSIASQQLGYCVRESFIRDHSGNISGPCNFENCCADKSRQLCFLMHMVNGQSKDTNTLCDDHSLSEEMSASNLARYFHSFTSCTTSPTADCDPFANSHRKICLPARRVTELAIQFCSNSSSCVSTYYGQSVCVRPFSLAPLTRLIVLEVESKDASILFWGPAAELYQALSLSESRPRFTWIPILTIQQVNVFYRYLFSLSFSVILFNLLPYNPFDGYHIFSLTSLYFFRNKQEHLRQKFLFWAHVAATAIVLLCVLVGLNQLRQQLLHSNQVQ